MQESSSKKRAAGLLMFRNKTKLEFLLAHPGGPYYRNKDEGAWGIPKGQIEAGEDHLTAAIREFKEETNIDPQPPFIALEPIKYSKGKVVHAFAFELGKNVDFDIQARFKSNDFNIEWPPKSGRFQRFPEIDKIAWFSLEAAKVKIHPAQLSFLLALAENLQRKGLAPK